MDPNPFVNQWQAGTSGLLTYPQTVVSGSNVYITTSGSGWLPDVPPVAAAPKESGPLEWLRSQVDEICALGAAI